MYELIVIAWLFGGPVPDYHLVERWDDFVNPEHNRYDCQSAGMVARGIFKKQYHLDDGSYKIKCIKIDGISI